MIFTRDMSVVCECVYGYGKSPSNGGLFSYGCAIMCGAYESEWNEQLLCDFKRPLLLSCNCGGNEPTTNVRAQLDSRKKKIYLIKIKVPTLC